MLSGKMGGSTANKPDKGKKDGSCNVTACQAPLAGTMQGWMVNHTVKDGRLYYCDRCCRRFNEYDDQLIRAGREKSRRITWDETTGPRIAGIHEDGPVAFDADTRPSEVIIREQRDAWPDRQQ